MARLPIPGDDKGTWGKILNDFLNIAHNNDGTLKDTGVVAQKYTLANDGIPESDLDPAVQAKLNGGGAGDATASTKGVLQLTGDLSGTASSPTIATGAITDTHVSDSAAIAQSKIADLTSDLAAKQASNADLTAITALTPTNNDILQRKSGVWTNSSPAQVKTDLGLVKGDVDLGNVDNTSDADKNAASATLTNKTIDVDNNTLTNIEINNFKTSAIVTESEGLNSSDNDTSFPTTAAVKDYVDDQVVSAQGEPVWIETGAGTDIDWGVPLLHVTLAANWIPSLVNPPDDPNGGAQVTIKITMSGSHAITWPPEIQWAGSKPTPSNGDQIIIEILRSSQTDIMGWQVSDADVIQSVAPGDVSGLVEHLDAHVGADSIVLSPQEDVDAFVGLMTVLGASNVWAGARMRTWNAEVGNNVAVGTLGGFYGGPAVLTDPAGRRCLVYSAQGSTNAAQGANEFAALGVLANHTVIIVCGPIWSDNPLGAPVGFGSSGIVLSNDHKVTPLADDYIFGYNHATHPASLGVRWQEAGSGTTNRVISDPRTAPAYPDVYATRYDGTDWEFFRRSGRASLSTYSQANIDIGNNGWAVGSAPGQAFPYQGVVYEIVIYDQALSDNDLTAVMDGLVKKWNL